MPDLKKLLSKLNGEERNVIEALIKDVVSLHWKRLDIKKLKGHQNIFRVRRGKMRIIFFKDKKEVRIFNIERRSERTYKF